jgi:hypothetical protein
MTIFQLSFLAVRLYSLTLVFAAIGQAEQALILPSMGTADSHLFAISCGLNAVLYLAVAAVFLGRTQAVARFLAPFSRAEVESGSPDSLLIAGISLAGLIFLVKGGSDLLAISTDWVLRQHYGLTGPYTGYSFSLPAAVAAATKTLIGLWLLVGASRVSGLIQRARARLFSQAHEDQDADA